jgi:hypothetical protein
VHQEFPHFLANGHPTSRSTPAPTRSSPTPANHALNVTAPLQPLAYPYGTVALSVDVPEVPVAVPAAVLGLFGFVLYRRRSAIA